MYDIARLTANAARNTELSEARKARALYFARIPKELWPAALAEWKAQQSIQPTSADPEAVRELEVE